jgi:hypothetical protein
MGFFFYQMLNNLAYWGVDSKVENAWEERA